MSDFDSPWKEALEQFFPAFLKFFFPQVHAAIDWSREYEALDTELQQIEGDRGIRRRCGDGFSCSRSRGGSPIRR